MRKIYSGKFYVMLCIITSLALMVACSNQKNPSPSSTPDQVAQTQAAEPVKDDPAKAIGKIVIGWVPPDITGVYKIATTLMEKSAEDAKKSGLDVEVLTKASNNHSDSSAQIQNIEDLIQRKVSAIIISPADVDPLKPVLKEAEDAHIPVIIVNLLEPIEGAHVDSYIGFDNAQAAEVSGYALLNALGGPGVLDGKGKKVDVQPHQELDLKWWQNVYKDVDPNSIKGKIAILAGAAGSFYDNEREKGFEKVIKQFPNVQVVAKQSADWNRQKGVTAAENILQNHKDIDGFWAASNEMALGAINAVENAGLTGKVFVTTNDGTPESVDRIRDGKILTETWHGFPEWGWYGVKFAVMLHLGEEVPKTYDIRPRTEFKGNADDFYPNPSLDAIDWQQIISQAKTK